MRLLPLSDQQSLSLASQATRKLTLPFVFGHLKYTQWIINKIRNIHQARQDVKEVIKKLVLNTSRRKRRGPEYFPVTGDDKTLIFRFLETLPNLQAFEFCHLIPPVDISHLIASLRHAPLLEFTFNNRTFGPVKGPPAIGLPDLEKLSLIWTMDDAADQPRSAHSHLYELIRPSLTTLVELCIEDLPLESTGRGTEFDLQLLKPAGDTLLSFEYRFESLDESILDTIPVIFPRLTTLKMVRWNKNRQSSCLWKDEHINALARSRNLTDLVLSSDFEVQAGDMYTGDRNYAWFFRSYERRLKATQEVALAIELQRCCWIQYFSSWRHGTLEHHFIVEDRLPEGKRVRGVKQHWMGRDHRSLDGTVVKCKLEDLPGDIIGENDINLDWLWQDAY